MWTFYKYTCVVICTWNMTKTFKKSQQNSYNQLRSKTNHISLKQKFIKFMLS